MAPATSGLYMARILPLLVLFALTAQAPSPQFKSGVDVIRFDVVVLDKDRHPISGLTAEDFRVTENGNPVRVAGFQAVTIPGAAAPPEPSKATFDPHVDVVTNQRRGPGRLVVIVMDRTIPHEWPMTHAREIADAAIDALGPNDLGAVLFTSQIAGTHGQGFTANRQRLHAAVASLQMGATTNVDMSFQGLSRGGLHFNEGECMCGLCALETLTNVAASLATVQDYRKMIFFIGTDVPLSENSYLAHAVECRGRMTEPSAKLFRTLDRANVTIHSFDPVGLDTAATTADNTPPESADSRQIRQGELGTLSSYTGGRLIALSNDEPALVPALFDESRSYYVIAIERSPAAKGERPHTIKIETARSGATVLSRTIYMDALPDRVKKASADPLERALAELLPETNLPLRMELAPSTTRGSSVDVTLATPRSAPARADVLIGVFDEFSKQVGVEHAQIELPARGGADVTWTMHLNPKPGRYEVRAAVRVGDQIGTVIGHVEVARHR